jgi:hypothetical protein
MYTFIKVLCKTNLYVVFTFSKLNDLKVIHNLYSQCLTQIMSKMNSFTKPEGVYYYTPSLLVLVEVIFRQV